MFLAVSDSGSTRADFPSEERENEIRENIEEDYQSNTEEEAAPRARHHPKPPQDAAAKLFDELNRVVQSNVKFEAYGRDQILESATALVRYGAPSLERLRTTGDQARKYLPDDMRETEKAVFPRHSSYLKAKQPYTS